MTIVCPYFCCIADLLSRIIEFSYQIFSFYRDWEKYNATENFGELNEEYRRVFRKELENHGVVEDVRVRAAA